MAKRGRPRKKPAEGTDGDNGSDNVVNMATGALPGVEGPGVSPLTIPDVEAAAEAYVRARDRRQALTEKESEAKRELITQLHANAEKIGKHPDTGEIRYVYNGGDKDRRVVVLKPSDEVLKVKDVEAFEEVSV